MIELMIVLGAMVLLYKHAGAVTGCLMICMGATVGLIILFLLIGVAMRPGPDPKVAAFIKSLDEPTKIEPQRTLVVVPDPDPLAQGRSLDAWARANAPLTPLWN